MLEKWKDVVGYEGHYMVSSEGHIKSVGRTVKGSGIGSGNGDHIVKERILKYVIHKQYKCVTLVKGGTRKTMKIHRLVASAFIPNPENKPQVNHIDANKFNNFVDNLEWVSGLENQQHAHKMGLFDDLINRRSKNVLQMDLSGDIIAVWQSASECGRHGFSREHVRDCCLAVRRSHKGYRWVYA